MREWEGEESGSMREGEGVGGRRMWKWDCGSREKGLS